jgi:hypothetical protein
MPALLHGAAGRGERMASSNMGAPRLNYFAYGPLRDDSTRC